MLASPVHTREIYTHKQCVRENMTQLVLKYWPLSNQVELEDFSKVVTWSCPKAAALGRMPPQP